ncbi:hypothetical protein HCH_03889 [Hahella chejuensis KCTC 2396]|uniref:Uncharacterized protein n=1 Tax=Hahella chejuensis (strain KCTC 2396) TaxID=349521 RepID=Q2SFG1_HAHCH|nr:hypothetical protein HCH_03889 [Hahella chejuensis KCTC 2396]
MLSRVVIVVQLQSDPQSVQHRLHAGFDPLGRRRHANSESIIVIPERLQLDGHVQRQTFDEQAQQLIRLRRVDVKGQLRRQKILQHSRQTRKPVFLSKKLLILWRHRLSDAILIPGRRILIWIHGVAHCRPALLQIIPHGTPTPGWRIALHLYGKQRHFVIELHFQPLELIRDIALGKRSGT